MSSVTSSRRRHGRSMIWRCCGGMGGRVRGRGWWMWWRWRSGAVRWGRQEPVVAIGGGIVGALAGFAAAVYRRGVPVIQCPTTLLAMVDAAVGGKTGVNLSLPGEGLKKNMVGAFHQPRGVVADVAAL